MLFAHINQVARVSWKKENDDDDKQQISVSNLATACLMNSFIYVKQTYPRTYRKAQL